MREQELEGRCGRKLGCCAVEGCLMDTEMREHWQARAAEDGNAAMASVKVAGKEEIGGSGDKEG